MPSTEGHSSFNGSVETTDSFSECAVRLAREPAGIVWAIMQNPFFFCCCLFGVTKERETCRSEEPDCCSEKDSSMANLRS